jgi:hypothetical protein
VSFLVALANELQLLNIQFIIRCDLAAAVGEASLEAALERRTRVSPHAARRSCRRLGLLLSYKKG